MKYALSFCLSVNIVNIVYYIKTFKELIMKKFDELCESVLNESYAFNVQVMKNGKLENLGGRIKSERDAIKTAEEAVASGEYDAVWWAYSEDWDDWFHHVLFSTKKGVKDYKKEYPEASWVSVLQKSADTGKPQKGYGKPASNTSVYR